MTKKRVVTKKRKTTKKRNKKSKKAISNKKNKDAEAEIEEQPPKSIDINDTERQIQLLIEKGKKKGFLTYEEMN
ncbi:MAG: RNA polymerase sigma factor region1.1 domain-containing protein, partial [Sedimentisphaerales bacterium]|nr:RNA polymerase sigma factor region1.1 domain-containing protein [Sedimentisphaerales bacterium]